MSAAHTPSPLDRHRVAIRDAGHSATPYRLGKSVGRAGENLPSPYAPGSSGDMNYRDGLRQGRWDREQDRRDTFKAAAKARAAKVKT